MGSLKIPKGSSLLALFGVDLPLCAVFCFRGFAVSRFRGFAVSRSPSVASNESRPRLDGPVPKLEEPSRTAKCDAAARETQRQLAAGWEKRRLPELQAGSEGVCGE